MYVSSENALIHRFFKEHVTMVTRKRYRIVRFSNKKAMMQGLDGLLVSLIHNNVTRVNFLAYLFVTVFYICTVYCYCQEPITVYFFEICMYD